jgi:hypothetical protein
MNEFYEIDEMDFAVCWLGVMDFDVTSQLKPQKKPDEFF